MYYVCGYDPYSNLVEVIDTVDNKKECYSRESIRVFLDNNIRITGVHLDSLGRMRVTVSNEKIKLDTLNSMHGVLGVGSYVRRGQDVIPIYTGVPQRLKIDDVVTRVTSDSFNNADRSKVERVELSKNCKSIGARAFYGMRNLKEVILNEGLLSIDGDAFGCTSIKSFKLPSTLLHVASNGLAVRGFMNQDYPTSKLVFPKYMEFLGTNASNFIAVKMPEVVRSVGERYKMFLHCTKIVALKGLVGGMQFAQLMSWEDNIIVCTDDPELVQRVPRQKNAKVLPYDMFDAVCEHNGIT